MNEAQFIKLYEPTPYKRRIKRVRGRIKIVRGEWQPKYEPRMTPPNPITSEIGSIERFCIIVSPSIRARGQP